MQTQNIILSEEYTIPTKAEIAEQIQRVTDQVADGTINPLRAYGLLAALEKVVAEAKKAIQDLALMEADKYPDKTNDVYGAQFQIKEAGVKYDFSDSPEWNALQVQIEELKARQKGVETTLKALGQCAKSSTTTLQVNFSKQ